LQASGFDVASAVDASEALTKIAQLLPDVVIADVGLPGTDGFALCRQIKDDDRTAAIPVIGVSGYSFEDRDERARRAGFDTLILKPCLPDDLVAQITTTVEKTRQSCGDAAALCMHAADLREGADEAVTACAQTRMACERTRSTKPAI
jgi:CheY-like chemotaxis protein